MARCWKDESFTLQASGEKWCIHRSGVYPRIVGFARLNLARYCPCIEEKRGLVLGVYRLTVDR